jgi:hypothetical protein
MPSAKLPKPAKLVAADFGRLWHERQPDQPCVVEYHFTRPLVGDTPTGPARPGIRERMAGADLHDWRFDYAWPAVRVAVEIDGGQSRSMGGRHNTDGDRDKHNLAATQGWRVLHFSLRQLNKATAKCLTQVAQALEFDSPEDT